MEIGDFLAWRLKTAQYGEERLLMYMERFMSDGLLFIFLETIISKCIQSSDIKCFSLLHVAYSI